MNKLLSFVLIMCVSIGVSNAQTIDELKKQRDEKAAEQADLQGKADALAGEVVGLSDQIIKLSGWQTGLNGVLGFNFNKSDKWAANPNPSSSSSALNFGMTAFANQNKDKFFWNNKGILQKAWQDVDVEGGADNGKLFDNGTVDLINLSSLYGYKLSDNFAISALGELNTSLSEFFKVGTFDIGVGATWTPVQNLVVVIHPLNYHAAFARDGFDGSGSIGAKVRADYTRDVTIGGKGFAWSSTLTTFLPYQQKTPDLFEWTWLNNLSFSIWKGVGVGVGLGLRQSDVESAQNDLVDGTQLFYTVGLSYGF